MGETGHSFVATTISQISPLDGGSQWYGITIRLMFAPRMVPITAKKPVSVASGTRGRGLAATSYLVLIGLHIWSPTFDAEFTSPLDCANEVTLRRHRWVGAGHGRPCARPLGAPAIRSGITASQD